MLFCGNADAEIAGQVTTLLFEVLLQGVPELDACGIVPSVATPFSTTNSTAPAFPVGDQVTVTVAPASLAAARFQNVSCATAVPALFCEFKTLNEPPEIEGEIEDTPDPPTTAACTTSRSPFSTALGTVTATPLVPALVAFERVAIGSIVYGTGKCASFSRNSKN
jgi:hypothetical protein